MAVLSDTGHVLVVNTGSSSLKLHLLDGQDRVVESWDSLPAELPAAGVVVHRVVHGGAEFSAATVIDAAVEERLRALTVLAPLHQPKMLAALSAVRERLPDAIQVACFDTAFHMTMPARATTYALPVEWNERYGLRRYGFHGLSHAWAAHRAAQLAPAARRVVTCHLGAGASLCAVVDGRSADTTMGFTPLEGLVMATRSGDVDPGLVTWLMEREHDVGDVLEHRSGLLGLAGSADMRELLARDDDAAGLALEVYVHRLAKGVAAMAASAGGIDACVFTGGVGEHAAAIRARAADALAWLGVAVDPRANEQAIPDADIGAPDAPVRTFVVAAREDLEMARQARTLLSG